MPQNNNPKNIIYNRNLQDALIDYIVTTPNNFNANLFRGFLTDTNAQNALMYHYWQKYYATEEDDPIIIEPPTPSGGHSY